MRTKLIAVFIFVYTGLFCGEAEEFIRFYQEGYTVGDGTKIIEEANRFLDKYPESKFNIVIKYMTGSAVAEKYNMETAEKELAPLLDTIYREDILKLLIETALKNDEPEKAESYFLQMKEGNMRVKTAIVLAGYFRNNNQMEKTLYYLEIPAGDSKYGAYGSLEIALINYMKKDYVVSVRYFDEYEKYNGGINDEYLYQTGFVNEKAGNYEKAENYYKKIIEKKSDKNSQKAVNGLFRIAVMQNNLDESVLYLGMMSEENNLKEKYMAVLAELMEKNGRKDEAEKNYRKIYARYDNKAAAIKIINNMLADKNYENALANLEIIRHTEYYNYYKIYLLYKLNKIDEITGNQEMLNSVSEDDYKYDETAAVISESFYLTKNYREALEYINKINLDNLDKKVVDGILFRKVKIGIALKNEGEINGALSKLKEGGALVYKDAVFAAGLWHEAEGRAEKAENIYKEFIKKNKDNEITRRIAVSLINRGRYAEAETYTKQLPAKNRDLYIKGVAGFGIKNYEQCEKIFQALYKDDAEPKERVLYYLMMSKYTIGKYDEYIKYSALYLAKYEKTGDETKIKRAMAYFKMQDYENALKEYDDIGKGGGSNRDFALFMKGEIYFNMEKYDKAVAVYEELIENFKDSKYVKESVYWLGNINYQAGDMKKAGYYYEKYIADYGLENADDIVINLGRIYEKTNSVDKAVEKYSQLAESTGQKELKSRMITKIVTIYADREEYANAGKWLEKLEEPYKKLYLKALLKEKENKTEEALGLFLQLVSDSEYRNEAEYHIGINYFNGRDYKNARKYFQNVVNEKIGDRKDEALIKIGESYEMEGEYAKSQEYYKQVIAKYYKNGFADTAYYRLAESNEKQGNIKTAVKYYEEIFKNFKTSEYYAAVVTRLLENAIKEKNTRDSRKYLNELERIDKSLYEEYKAKLLGGE